MDTICALSTPFGRSAIAVIRVSGPLVPEIADQIFDRRMRPRLATYTNLRDSSGRIIDQVLATRFVAPNSFTGLDVLEISCHGNPKIVEEILDEIVSRGTRLADAGEFTRQAMANGKIDVTEIEALDVILNSSATDGLRLAMKTKTEGLGGSVELLRQRFVDLQIMVESQLDFSDSEVGAFNEETMLAQADQLLNELNRWCLAFDSNQHLFGRWTAVLAGEPNSGKSSLFNAIIGSNKAIVYDQPGTTRDYLVHEVSIEGALISLIDTAGIRSNPGPIEALGIEKTLSVVHSADLVVWISEGGADSRQDLSFIKDKRILRVASKADLHPETANDKATDWLRVSAQTGQGVAELRKLLVPGGGRATSEGWSPLLSLRQRRAVGGAIDHLIRFRTKVAARGHLDAAAEDVRSASAALDLLLSPPKTEDLIRSIFSRFCIGK